MAVTSSQGMSMNQVGLFEEEEEPHHHQQQQQQEDEIPTQQIMGGFFSFPPPYLNFASFQQQSSSIKGGFLTNPPPSSLAINNNLVAETLFSSSSAIAAAPKQRSQDIITSFDLVGGPNLLSLQRSTPNDLWAWGEVNECLMSSKRGGGDDNDDDHHHHVVGVSAMKMKKIKTRRRVREPRFCFKTMSDVDVLDDGYKWRKYGQKVVKNTQHPRSYYRCTQDNCRVKKRVERLAEDPRMVITTYEGRHVHSPSHDDDDSSQNPTHHFLSNFFF